MTEQTDSQYYKKALELAEAGDHRRALECIEKYLASSPNDAQAMNDAGAILHCLGRSAEAIEHLVKARELMPDSAEILWNLAEAYIASGRAADAAALFADMERMGILNPDVLNRTANIFLNQNNKGAALDMLLQSLQLAPDQKVLRPMIDIIRSKRAKVAFFCGLKNDVKFLESIYTFAEHRFGVRFFEGQSVEQMYELMKWSDISWFEWCTNMAIEASKLPKVCKMIVRLHRFEAYGEWPGLVNWENVDTFITVGNSFVRDALLKQVPQIARQTSVVTIPNGVDFDRFKFLERHRGKNIGCIGYLNMRKNPMFLLQCMQKLHYIDPEYKLYFAGVFQDTMLEQYVRHIVKALDLADVVFFDGWLDDVNAWLEDKHYIVSGSIGESQGMGVLEGMACGLKPVIHNFPGAEQIFDKEFLFNISEEFCKQICSDPYEPWRYREFVEENYPLDKQLAEINKILGKLEGQVEAQGPQPRKTAGLAPAAGNPEQMSMAG